MWVCIELRHITYFDFTKKNLFQNYGLAGDYTIGISYNESVEFWIELYLGAVVESLFIRLLVSETAAYLRSKQLSLTIVIPII
jgi:hypothetical protein